MPPVLDPRLAWHIRRPSVLPPRRVPAVAICPVAAVHLGDALAIERGTVGR
jgi:hypothetical protein